MSNTIEVLLADKYPLIRTGVRAVLSAEEDLRVVAEATSGNEAQQLSQKLDPDVLLFGLNMSGPTLSEIVAYLREHRLNVKVLVLDVGEKICIHDLFTTGVAGYLAKDEETETIAHAIRVVAQGHVWFSQTILERKRENLAQTEESTLTDQEQRILSMIAKGWDNAHIAAELCLAKQTVRNYISRIYDKLGLSSRVEAVVWVMERDNFSERSLSNTEPVGDY